MDKASSPLSVGGGSAGSPGTPPVRRSRRKSRRPSIAMLGKRLYDACGSGDLARVRAALEANPDLSWVDVKGLTAAHAAAAGGHVGALKLLLEAGAPVDAADATIGWTPLLRAVYFGHVGSVKVLAESGKVDLEARETNSGKTALMLAAGYGHEEVVRVLLAAGALPAGETQYGKTALDYAKEGGARSVKCLEVIQHAIDGPETDVLPRSATSDTTVEEASVSLAIDEEKEEGAGERSSPDDENVADVAAQAPTETTESPSSAPTTEATVDTANASLSISEEKLVEASPAEAGHQAGTASEHAVEEAAVDMVPAGSGDPVSQIPDNASEETPERTAQATSTEAAAQQEAVLGHSAVASVSQVAEAAPSEATPADAEVEATLPTSPSSIEGDGGEPGSSAQSAKLAPANAAVSSRPTRRTPPAASTHGVEEPAGDEVVDASGGPSESNGADDAVGGITQDKGRVDRAELATAESSEPAREVAVAQITDEASARPASSATAEDVVVEHETQSHVSADVDAASSAPTQHEIDEAAVVAAPKSQAAAPAAETGGVAAAPAIGAGLLDAAGRATVDTPVRGDQGMATEADEGTVHLSGASGSEEQAAVAISAATDLPTNAPAISLAHATEASKSTLQAQGTDSDTKLEGKDDAAPAESKPAPSPSSATKATTGAQARPVHKPKPAAAAPAKPISEKLERTVPAATAVASTAPPSSPPAQSGGGCCTIM